MAYGKAYKKAINHFKKKAEIRIAYNNIDVEKTYDYEDKPSITGKQLKEIFESKYKWLKK